MAGETSSSRSGETPGPEQRRVATGWLVALWSAALAAATAFALYSALTYRPGSRTALLPLVAWVYATSYGGPIFLLTWFWLTATPGFRHEPFLWTLAIWLLLGLGFPDTIGDGGGPLTRGWVAVMLVLPALGSYVMLRVVLGARTRQRDASEKGTSTGVQAD